MRTYAILLHPGHNRVYFEESKRLSVAELQVALETLALPYGDLRVTEIAGVPYLLFAVERPPARAEWEVLANLSFIYAVFAVREGEETAFAPVELMKTRFLDENISTILKYTGKTNELFTRLMINLAHLTSDFRETSRIRLLDPVAMKGTTLFEGLIRGFDVCGVDIMEKPVHEGCTFLKKYLETEKLRHTTHTEKCGGPGVAATRHSFEIARTKDELKSGRSRHAEFVAGDARYVNYFFKKNSVELIVGDLPYGVQHGSISGGKATLSGRTRNPAELLRESLPAWREVLKPGGAMVLSWNRFVLPRTDMADILTRAGLTVCDMPDFSHRVDQTILRDVIVAKK